MSEPDFIRVQRQFAAHLRHPGQHPAPAGIEDRRLAIYREVFFNNVENFVANGFPVLRSMLSEQDWLALVREFYANYTCQSPYFVEVPRHFVEFLTARQDSLQLPPWALELAHYEWMELVLDISTQDWPQQGINAEGDPLAEAPVLSPLMCLLSYHWPVHKLSASFVPEQPLAEPVWLVVYRNRDDVVKFMEVNAATAALLQALDNADQLSGRALLARLAGQLGMAEAQVLEFGAPLLVRLRDSDIIVGTRPARS